MASTKSIAEAIKSIPEKKESLRKALEELRSFSGYLSSFSLKWQDLEDHLSSIQTSIDLRFKQLEAKEKNSFPAPTPPKHNEDQKEADATEAIPRHELVDLCAKMDGAALRAFVSGNRNDLQSLRTELAPAIRAAPDPARLVLDAVRGFYSANPKAGAAKDADHFNRRTCILLMERLCVVKPEISGEVAEDAKKMADEWKGRTSDKGDNSLQAWGFLQLLAAYHIASKFDIDEILDIIVPISRRKPIIDVCKALDITDHIPTLIEKLISKGKQLDAVKFVYAYGLVENFPPVPLLKDYVKESKKVAQEVRRKGNNSAQSRNEATAKEISALKSVIKAIEDYKLESEYPVEQLQQQVHKLEKMKTEKKRTATVPNPQNQHENGNKRPRAAFGGSLAAAAAYTPAPLSMNQSQPYMADRASYLGSAGPYGLPGVALYDRAGPGLLEPSLVTGAKLSPPKSYLYPPESHITSGPYERPGAYERPVAYDMPISYDRQAAYDRSTTYERPSAYGNYTLSGGLP